MKYLGIDVSKDKFDVALLEGKKVKHKVFKNNEDGFERLLEWLDNIQSVHACMESTGRYGDNLAIFLHEKGYKVSIVNPACVKAFCIPDGIPHLPRASLEEIRMTRSMLY